MVLGLRAITDQPGSKIGNEEQSELDFRRIKCRKRNLTLFQRTGIMRRLSRRICLQSLR